jgi:hypothetical protein
MTVNKWLCHETWHVTRDYCVVLSTSLSIHVVPSRQPLMWITMEWNLHIWPPAYWDHWLCDCFSIFQVIFLLRLLNEAGDTVTYILYKISFTYHCHPSSQSVYVYTLKNLTCCYVYDSHVTPCVTPAAEIILLLLLTIYAWNIVINIKLKFSSIVEHLRE